MNHREKVAYRKTLEERINTLLDDNICIECGDDWGLSCDMNDDLFLTCLECGETFNVRGMMVHMSMLPSK